jgi:roadblock/LC7 domain-containing protein
MDPNDSALDASLRSPGAIAVGQYSADGRLIAYKSNEPAFTKELAIAACQYTATARMFLTTLAASFSQLTQLPMVPFNGFIYSGGDMSGILQADRWRFVRTNDSELRSTRTGAGLDLEELLALPGVRLAGYYTADGNEIACKQTLGLAPEAHATAAQLVASTTAALRGMGTAFSFLSGATWAPFKTWLYSGGDWVAVANQNCWILAEAGESDPQALHVALLPGNR